MSRPILLLLAVMLLPCGRAEAQRARNVSVVVADALTHMPVARASLYTKENGRFHSCITDEQGRALISFDWQRLTVSHLSYERRTLHRTAPDTIFLQPRYQSVGEVVVTNKEPEWIRRCLKRAVRQKERYYFSRDDVMPFDYHTQSLTTNSLYRFRMTGLLRTRSTHHDRYAMCPDTATIVAADSTRLTDTSQLRRMLYEDFMDELDDAFVRTHRYSVNYDYQGGSDDVVQLFFRSKSHVDDRGWMVVDTCRAVVLSAYRFTGTKTNKRERLNPLLYHFARLMGYHIDSWTRDYRVTYAVRPDSTLYPAEVRYKFFYAGRDSEDSDAKEFEEQTGGGFPNMEATLTLGPSASATLTVTTDSIAWISLPPSWYIKYNTDSDRRAEVELSSLPATFSIFEGD